MTGLQTFQPYGILSTWGWHNFSLPTTPGQTSPDDFTGLQWWTHGRLVPYEQPNPAQNDISNWLRENPHRLNLGNIGFQFGATNKTVTEADLKHKSQVLDLWSGKLSSSFVYNRSQVQVETWVEPDSDTVAIAVDSKLLKSGGLGLFFDFPYPDKEKFNAPFVGLWNATDKHQTTVEHITPNRVIFQHALDDYTYFVTVSWEGNGDFSSVPAEGTHRYFFTTNATDKIRLTATYNINPDPIPAKVEVSSVAAASRSWWASYWTDGAFVDLSAVESAEATELQRRIIISHYLLAVNSASDLPPQESGLVNNGWHGKFHLEMNLWNSLHFARWGRWPLLWRSTPGVYDRFLESSLERARLQGYEGARWGKMTDPEGRSAPGEINSLLIWQQPHPMYFAEVEYRAFPNLTTLEKWDKVLTATADFMASFAFFNESTGVYDLGPPIYPVSENTNPNTTINPTFELTYWRFGLDVARRWKERQGLPVPEKWITVRNNLAPLPVAGGAYAVYEGIPGMWTDNATTMDHPAMAGIYGLLPPLHLTSLHVNYTTTITKDMLQDEPTLRRTAAKIKELWDLDQSYGWDFAMLAMNSLRFGDPDEAVAYLLHPTFQFDDAGYPVGGSRVPTPYFPNAASLLLAVAMMAGGWDGVEGKGPHFPVSWADAVEVEGFLPAL